MQGILARFDDSVLVLNERIRNSTPAGNSLNFEQQRELITMQRRTVFLTRSKVLMQISRVVLLD